MTAYLDPCDSCQRCLGCGRRWCAAEVDSPGEASGLCVECWAVEDPEAVA